MRQKFNRNAICSSKNYRASKHAHLDMLKEKHEHFNFIAVSGEIQIDVPKTDFNDRLESRFKTIRIFGKEMRLTIEEYNTHYAKCNF